MFTRLLNCISARPSALGGRALAVFCALCFADLPMRAAEKTILTDEHVDIAVAYTAEPSGEALSISIDVDDSGSSYAPDDVILVVLEQAKYTLPSGTPFGEAGDPLWILPQSQVPDLLYMGVSAEKVPAGAVTDPVELKLLSVEGPGDFFAWQASQFGGIQVRMNSRDGISEDDRTTPFVGSHEHLNWGFSTNGIYTVTVQASARRSGDLALVSSAPARLTFHVLPLPDNPETPFQKWQREQFGPDAATTTGAAGADPDSDGVVNLAEYALAMDPHEADRELLPRIVSDTVDGSTYAVVKYRRAAEATDVDYLIDRKGSLDDGPWTVEHIDSPTEPGPSDQWVQWKDPEPVAGIPHRFYRIRVRLRE